MLKNNEHSYGLIAKIVHWLCAIIIIGLFALGLWMLDLNYYDNWYTLAPHYHVSIGILLAVIMVFRVLWRLFSVQPKPTSSLSKLEHILAYWVHYTFYVIIFGIIVTGYLIPTGDNRSIDVFNWFTLPSLGALFDQQADIAGRFHLWMSYGLMGLIALHALAALKHQFVDRDGTLKRML
ncbi:cytochrome b [Candidatus Endobugula sertula]|uniref:Cytochrome b n=1 Tax=Candidatus Endobugula sertula TaxID=62101 RepID=A0A1D2QM08_9GAMM|nr:cytochrome b [Candidatus Endobugula sertula]